MCHKDENWNKIDLETKELHLTHLCARWVLSFNGAKSVYKIIIFTSYISIIPIVCSVLHVISIITVCGLIVIHFIVPFHLSKHFQFLNDGGVCHVCHVCINNIYLLCESEWIQFKETINKACIHFIKYIFAKLIE